MLTRRLPGTDLDLSVIGFGCWTIGGEGWGEVREEESLAAVREAVELGINWFDTAPIYGDGHADEVLVRALGPRLRDVTIATKVGVRIDPDSDGGHVISDLTPRHIAEDTEASLARLGVERIDLLQVHWPCERGTPLEDSLEALVRLQEQGKIRHFGLCNYAPDELRRARTLANLASLQTPYSLLRREFELSLRRVCAGEPPLGVLAYEPLCRGLLTGKYTRSERAPTFPDTDLRARDERFQGERYRHARGLTRDLERAAGKLGVTAAALAIGWVAGRPGVTAVIAGARSPEQIRQNTRAASLIDRTRVWRVVSGIAAIHGGS